MMAFHATKERIVRPMAWWFVCQPLASRERKHIDWETGNCKFLHWTEDALTCCVCTLRPCYCFRSCFCFQEGEEVIKMMRRQVAVQSRASLFIMPWSTGILGVSEWREGLRNLMQSHRSTTLWRIGTAGCRSRAPTRRAADRAAKSRE